MAANPFEGDGVTVNTEAGKVQSGWLLIVVAYSCCSLRLLTTSAHYCSLLLTTVVVLSSLTSMVAHSCGEIHCLFFSYRLQTGAANLEQQYRASDCMCQVAAVECALHNGRADSELVNQSGKSLWRRGFMCLSHESSVNDFHDTDQVEQVTSDLLADNWLIGHV